MSCRSKGWLLTSLVVIGIACVSLLYVYVVSKGKQSEDRGYQNVLSISEKFTEEKCLPVCDTKECVLFAKFMLRSVKSTVDPCEDMQGFMCGSYEEKFAEEEGMSMYFDTENTMYKILNGVINDVQADSETASGKMKILYDSCMNYAFLEKNAFLTAQNVLDDIGISDWPNLPPDFRFFNTDIPTILGNLEAKGEALFLMLIVDEEHTSRYNFPRGKRNVSARIDGRYFNTLLQLPPKESVIHIMNFFDLDSRAIDQIWNDYTSVRQALLKLKDENCRQLTLDCAKLPDEDDWFSFVYAGGNCTQLKINCTEHNEDWAEMCKTLEVFINASGYSDRMNKKYLIIEDGDDHFMKHIIPVLNSFPERTVANFLALSFYMDHLEELNLYFQLTKELYFPRKRCEIWRPPGTPDRWKFCTRWIAQNMMFPLKFEFLEKYFILKEIEKVSDLFQECKADAIDIISRQEWMPEGDRDILINRMGELEFSVDTLKEYLAKPKIYQRAVNHYYKSFHPVPENFFLNVLELRRTISDIHRLTSRFAEKFRSHKFEIQAHAMMTSSIEIDFGLLIPPYYTIGLERLMNLIMFGSTAGHEMGHSLDYVVQDLGNITNHEIEEKKQCITNHYSKFKWEYSNENVNGSQYLNENFADIAYVEMLDRLIEKHISSHEDFLLPGIPYSSKQLMYIADSLHWCSKSVEAEEVFFRDMAAHSPHKIRMIGAMQNSRGYSDAFNCSQGSYMNPTSKCSIML